MAEGLIGGILGEEDEKPEAEAAEAVPGAEAFAAAIVAIASRQDPQVARETSIFLGKQSRLLDIQAKHLEEEHALRLGHLRGQKYEGTLRRAGIRIRIAFQLFTAIVAALFAAGLVLLVRDAITSRSVVIDPVDVAPNIAAHVPSDKIVAAGLLDVLAQIQAATRTSAERRSLSNAWTSEIEIEVPETGVSIGQLERILKTRFGHDTHIDGDLVQTEKGGLALTVRGTGILPKTFSDAGSNLEKLTTEAGEYIYSQSQPGLWMNYLVNNGRNDEAIRFAGANYNAVNASERPFVLNYWANAISASGGPAATAEALPLWRETVRLKPDFWTGYNNVLLALVELGREEETIAVVEQIMKIAGGRPGRAPEITYQNYDQLVFDIPAMYASNLADLESHPGIGTSTAYSGALNLSIAQIEVQMHDLAAAQIRLKTIRVDEKVLPDVASAALTRASLAEERGDLTTASAEWDVFRTAAVDPGYLAANGVYICYSAVTYQKTGQPQKADAALSKLEPLTLVDCDRFRGDVLDLRGDWVGAQAWYAKAAQLAPSLPAGYFSWGVALAKHGDLAGAVAKLQLAHQKGPHWADPLKAWGDVLLKQGKAQDALAKYDEALKFAPNWSELQAARDALANHKS